VDPRIGRTAPISFRYAEHRAAVESDLLVPSITLTMSNTYYQVFDEGHFKGEKNEGFVIAVAFLRSSHKINGVTKFTDFW
jgi:hypothetical protein